MTVGFFELFMDMLDINTSKIFLIYILVVPGYKQKFTTRRKGLGLGAT